MEMFATHKWMKPALMGLVVLICTVLGIITDVRLLGVLLFGFAALGGVLLLIKQPGIGLPLLVITAMVVPYGLGTGTETSISAAMVLLVGLIGLWLVKELVEKHTVILAPSATVLPLLLLVLSAFVSLVIGQLDWFPIQHASLSAQIGGWMLFALSAGAFLLAANVIKDTRWLQYTVWAFLGAAGLYVLAVLVRPFGQMVERFIDTRAFGSVFWVWLFALAFSQLFFNRDLKLAVKLGLVALMGAAGYIALVQNLTWTSGWLPPLVGLAAIMLVSRSRLIYVVIVVGIAAAFFNYQAIYGALMVGDNAYSLDTRLAAWEILLKILEVNALFGLGPSNYYWYTPLFRIMGYFVPFNSHNNYVDIVAQTGLIGLFFYLLFFWRMGRLSLAMLSRVPEGFPKAYAIGVVGGVVGTVVAGMFGDWVIPFVYNIGFIGFRASMIGWLFLGGLVALEQMYPKRSDS